MYKTIAAFIVSLLSVIVFGANASAMSIDKACENVDIVFARGSGQNLGQSESSRLKLEIEARISKSSTLNFYELGTESYGGHKYPAIDVGNVFNGNPIGAWVSAGQSNDYGKSVDAGVGELYNYVVARNAKCPNARIVLGGYSQGAQVVGQTLPKFSDAVKSKIDFVALFGDPKLYLPEGEGLFPAACRGLDYSLWRRHIGTCGTDNGALGARKNPYVSTAMASKTGLWCNAADFICGTSKIVGDQAGHGKYKDAGGAIDQAAKEIAIKLKSTLPNSDGVDSESQVYSANARPDIVLAIASDSLQKITIHNVINYLNENAEEIKSQGGRVALVASRDAYNYRDNQAVVLSDFTDNTKDLVTYLNNFQYSGGGMIQWSGAHVVRTALDDLSWREQSSKSILYLTNDVNMTFDTSPSLKAHSLLGRAIEKGGISYYALGLTTYVSSHQAFSNMLSGRVLTTEPNRYAADFASFFATMRGRPQIVSKNTEYSAKSGQEIVFEVSDLQLYNPFAARSASVTEYHWDFLGDGIVDQITTTPVVSHTFDEPFDGYTIVKTVTSSGQSANKGIPVKIDMEPTQAQLAAPSNINIQVLETKNAVSTIKVSWEGIDPLTKSIAVGVNGTYLGELDATRSSVEVRDIDRSQVNEITVVSISQDEVIGLETTKTIEVAPKEPVGGGVAPKPSLLTLLLNAIRFILRGWGFVVSW